MKESSSAYGVLAAAIFAVLLLLFVYSVAEILLLLFVAVLFALYLGAVTDYLQFRFRMPRPAGLTVGLSATLLMLAALGLLIIPPVLEQTHDLITILPTLLAQWETSLLELVARYPLLAQILPPPDQARGYFSAVLAGVGGYFAGIFPYVFSGLHVVVNLISVLVMGIYLTLRPGLYRDGLVALFPATHRALVRDILAELTTTLRAWIVGMIIAMIFLGVLTYAGLWLLDVQYALAFGVFTGVVVIVPFFGTLVSTVLPALFVLGSKGLIHALLVVLLGVVVHLVEANVVHPMIMERKVNLPPVLSILSVLVMAELLGLIGLLVAVPVLATIMVVVRRIYVQRLMEGQGFRRVRRDPAAAAAAREAREPREPRPAPLREPSRGGSSLAS